MAIVFDRKAEVAQGDPLEKLSTPPVVQQNVDPDYKDKNLQGLYFSCLRTEECTFGISYIDGQGKEVASDGHRVEHEEGESYYALKRHSGAAQVRVSFVRGASRFFPITKD